MNKDRYPELGPKRRMVSLDACLAEVRLAYGHAYMEGSTGAERTFWVRSGVNRQLIAHAWPVSRTHDAMWLRVWPVDQLEGRVFA